MLCLRRLGWNEIAKCFSNFIWQSYSLKSQNNKSCAIKSYRNGTRVITYTNNEDKFDLVVKFDFYVLTVTTYEIHES